MLQTSYLKMNPEPIRNNERLETSAKQDVHKADADDARPKSSSPTLVPARGAAYIPRPDASSSAGSSKKARKWWLIAICAACAVGITLGLVSMNSPSRPSSGPPSQVQSGPVVQKDKILLVSDKDLDKEATENARMALKRGEIPPSLAEAPEQTRKEVLAGESALFKLHIIDSVAEDGDAVTVYMNGAPYGEIILSHAGADLTVALKRDSTAQLRIVATHDGGGGVTFGASSSLGEVRTRVMKIGDSEDWLISYK